ncbi:hypothetical protein J7K50_06790, partial [bacterium]|nr:hypothetical protein [bacterium]
SYERKDMSKGLTKIANFGIAFGLGILGGAALAIMLLEVRDCILRSASERKSDLANNMFDLVDDIAAISADIIEQSFKDTHHSPADVERIRQEMKTRLRKGGGLQDRSDSEEMKSLYSEIDPNDE